MRIIKFLLQELSDSVTCPLLYVKSLGYLGGALKLTPNTDTILAESARSAADFAPGRALKQLGDAIAAALG